MRRIAIGALAIAAALALPGAAATADARESANYAYKGYVGGLKIGTALIDVAFDDDKYGVELDLQVGGVVSWFVDWQNRSQATGVTRQADAAVGMPLAGAFYRNASEWEGKSRVIEVAYPDGVAELTRAVPHPVEDEGRPEVPASMLDGVIDPISAIVGLGAVIEKTGRCDMRFDVFDGRRLYDMKVVDDGEVEIGRSKRAPYGGMVRRCSFEFGRKAGFKRKNAGKEPTRGVAYFRESLGDTPVMPVQIKAETSYGAAVLHLQQITPLDDAAELQTLAPSKD